MRLVPSPTAQGWDFARERDLSGTDLPTGSSNIAVNLGPYFVGGFGGAWPRVHSLEDVGRIPGGLYNPGDRRVLPFTFLHFVRSQSAGKHPGILKHARRIVAIGRGRACGLAFQYGLCPGFAGC